MSEYHRNIVYCVATRGETMYLQCDAMRLAPIMLKSLRAHCNCDVIIATDAPDEPFTNGAEVLPLEPDEVMQLMQAKIHHLATYPFKDGDRVFVMDTDIIVQGDVFGVFDELDFDIGLAKRHYEYVFPINAGAWCFNYNNRTRLFLDEFDRCMHDNNYARGDGRWSDQDFLVSVYKSNLAGIYQGALSIVDIGYQYNYCPADDVFGKARAYEQLNTAASNPNYKVLHFKGELGAKDIMLKIAKEQGWM